MSRVTDAQVLEVVKQSRVVPVGLPVDPATRLAEDLLLSKLDVVELAFDMEDKFGISISDDFDPRTVADLIREVRLIVYRRTRASA